MVFDFSLHLGGEKTKNQILHASLFDENLEIYIERTTKKVINSSTTINLLKGDVDLSSY